ncbi:hemagglutinin, partial [Pseudomonas sp. FW305-3-2-15-C-R2A1]
VVAYRRAVAGGVKGATSNNSIPRNANNLVGGPLENATQISGRFKLDGGPANGALYRADNQGNITSYAVYDSAGMIIKRVDVRGAAHANVSTPHVIEYGRNTLPDGTVRVQSPSTKLAPRPTNSDEIP